MVWKDEDAVRISRGGRPDVREREREGSRVAGVEGGGRRVEGGGAGLRRDADEICRLIFYLERLRPFMNERVRGSRTSGHVTYSVLTTTVTRCFRLRVPATVGNGAALKPGEKRR